MISLTHADRDVDILKWTNSPSGPFHYTPESFAVTLDLTDWRQRFSGIDSVLIELPPTWITDRPTWRIVTPADHAMCWIASPREMPLACEASVTCTGFAHGRTVARETRSMRVELHGVSQFDPREDGIATPNSVDGWGVVPPERNIFDQTYSLALLRNRFFNGLYRSIVFLGSGSGNYQGGICTGMARVALERSLEPDRADASLERILIWHGRQLCDRALLAASSWLFVPSPRRAFETFRRELLADGTGRRCFDIGVPKPWRADLLNALQKEGHTVVPFAFDQTSDSQATVSVYDPNDPSASARGERGIVFDLRRNTYAYPGIASIEDRGTTVIAVEQKAYREGRTAILASLASLVMSAGTAVTRGVTTRARRLRQHRRAMSM